MQEEKPFLHIIAGPTASGKTALAVDLAKKLHAEIVSADSQQVYKYFDIGTAKPSAEELAQIPHHLVSVAEPTETFNATRYQTLADAAIWDIHQRGKSVVVVGGTGLYLRILLHGVVPTPGANPHVRKRWEEFVKSHGPQALHAQLQKVDPESAVRIHATDVVRLIRALEIFEATSVPPSVFRKQHEFSEERYPHRIWVLNPPRASLYEAINQRTESMFHRGLVEEVRTLVSQGFKDSSPMRAVGYVQALAVVEGRQSLLAAIKETAQKTRHYAKRQWTWFRKERGAEWIAPPYRLADLL